METKQLYHNDAYLKTFEAQVIAVEGDTVALSATAFYPGGGGQPHDLGTLTNGTQIWPVTKVNRQGGLIWHTVTGTPPEEGTTVTGNIDWEHRYALMRTHTAMHILCGVVWRDYGAKVTGGNMQPLYGRMDFEFENLSRDLVNEIELKINVEVDAARPTHVNFLPREEADQHPDLIRTKINLLPSQIKVIRTIEIEGLDLQADGGTHVNNTQEVGRIRIANYKSKGRINKRLEVALEATPS
ncbi:MAG: alanyl-tRNA editing protein [Anaerolineae bacterium]|nr:alanyl-tRNA editing protein [Anaerolineae bacterium]